MEAGRPGASPNCKGEKKPAQGRFSGLSRFFLDEQADVCLAAVLEVGGCADIFDAVNEV